MDITIHASNLPHDLPPAATARIQELR